MLFPEKVSSATHLQDDPDGLSVAVIQGRRGDSGRLSQRGHTEQNGPHHKSTAQCCTMGTI